MEDTVQPTSETRVSDPTNSSLQHSSILNRSTLQLVDRFAKDVSDDDLKLDGSDLDELREEYEINRPKVADSNAVNLDFASLGTNIAPDLPLDQTMTPRLTLDFDNLLDPNNPNPAQNNNNTNDEGSDFDWGAAITII